MAEQFADDLFEAEFNPKTAEDQVRANLRVKRVQLASKLSKMGLTTPGELRRNRMVGILRHALDQMRIFTMLK